MTTRMDRYDTTKEKIGGEVREAAGKVSGNDQLELKGKIQSSNADFKKKTNLHDNVNGFKESIAGKINDLMDKNKKTKKNKK